MQPCKHPRHKVTGAPPGSGRATGGQFANPPLSAACVNCRRENLPPAVARPAGPGRGEWAAQSQSLNFKATCAHWAGALETQVRTIIWDSEATGDRLHQASPCWEPQSYVVSQPMKSGLLLLKDSVSQSELSSPCSAAC